MRKVKYLLIISIVLLLTSCNIATEVPNPIIGTYSLKAESSSYDSAYLSLRKDGTFVFVQVVPRTTKTIMLEGTYTYTLRAFNFTEADGTITLTVSTPIPDGVRGTFLNEGSNFFLYGWTCDKDAGPQSLTLVINSNDSNSIYEFVYSGSEVAAQ